MKRAILFAMAMAVVPAAAQAEGDAAAGKTVFKKCIACHVHDNTTNKIGPHLADLIGRKAGSVPDFKYSEAMKKKGEEGLVWTEETVAAYLKDPRGYIPGNKMAFVGLKKDEDIANVIAYIKSPAE